MTDDYVVCAFRDKRSSRDAVDLIVREYPDFFVDRSSVYRKGLRLLIQTLEIESNLRGTKVNGPPKRPEDEIPAPPTEI
jgi:hypothetical protein